MRSCPFCGRVPHVRTYVSESLFNHNMVEWTEITCSTCDTALDVWNRRVISKKVEKQR